MTEGHYECSEHGQKRRMKRMKCLAYIAAFAVFQTIVIVAFVLTVMKIKSPKLRFGTVVVENYSKNGVPAFTLVAQVAVKNTNFGHFKYENSTVEVLYGGIKVGEASIAKGRVRARETKRFTVSVGVSSEMLSGNPNLGNDVNSGFLMMSSQAKLSGKVHLLKVMKKKKSAVMSCTWALNLATLSVQALNCK